jgi:hypothetical protein
MNDDAIVSLLCEKRSELIDQSPAVVRYRNLLAKFRIKAKGFYVGK